MRELIWREERCGNFVADVSCLRLKVHRIADRRRARFDVLRLHMAAGPALLASGTAHDLDEAMRVAQDTADRLGSILKRQAPLVVVVDGEETHSEAVADTLRDEGYDVVRADNAKGALRRIERLDRPAILVTDFYLGPGATGLELATMVRQLAPNTGVVFMSDVQPSGVNLWENGYLRMPFSAEELVTAVATVTTLCGMQPTSLALAQASPGGLSSRSRPPLPGAAARVSVATK
jgi:CheY-like chemotaxis protein